MPVKKLELVDDLTIQYKKAIEEILSDCEHTYRLTIDYALLDQKITELIAAAKHDGLEETIIWHLLQARIPTYVNYLNHRRASKKTA